MAPPRKKQRVAEETPSAAAKKYIGFVSSPEKYQRAYQRKKSLYSTHRFTAAGCKWLMDQFLRVPLVRFEDLKWESLSPYDQELAECYESRRSAKKMECLIEEKEKKAIKAFIFCD